MKQSGEFVGLCYYRAAMSTPASKQSISAHKLPLVDLHVHAPGGVLTRDILKQVLSAADFAAAQVIIRFRDDGTIDYKPGDFLDFLTQYDRAVSFIKTPEHVEKVIYLYLKRCAEVGCIYAELTCSPDHFKLKRNGFNANGSSSKQAINFLSKERYNLYINAVVSGIKKAKKYHGIDARILIVILRHVAIKESEHLLGLTIENPNPYVVGINMAGDEVMFPAPLFAKLYTAARKNGLKTTVHAGEHVDAETMLNAIKNLQPNRIGHGIACTDSDLLKQYLMKQNLCLEICPTSNIKVSNQGGNVYQKHPIHKIMSSSVNVALGSDDPGFFNSFIESEYAHIQKAGGYTNLQMLKTSENAVNASFAPDELKQHMLKKIEAAKLRLNSHSLKSNGVFRVAKPVDVDAPSAVKAI